MRFGKSRLFFSALFAFLIPLAMGLPARADLIPLGFPTGLAPWSNPNDGTAQGDPGSVTWNNGQATLTVSMNSVETELFLDFTIPTGAQSLQFMINSVVAFDTAPINGLPDFFAAGLVNPSTQISLVPTDFSNETSNSFYNEDIVNGAFNVATGMGVTVTPMMGLPAVVSVDLSSLDGQAAEIDFGLFGGSDLQSTSTVTISNVRIVTATAVPEPSSIITVLTALVGLAGASAIRSRRRSKAPTA